MYTLGATRPFHILGTSLQISIFDNNTSMSSFRVFEKSFIKTLTPSKPGTNRRACEHHRQHQPWRAANFSWSREAKSGYYSHLWPLHFRHCRDTRVWSYEYGMHGMSTYTHVADIIPGIAHAGCLRFYLGTIPYVRAPFPTPRHSSPSMLLYTWYTSFCPIVHCLWWSMIYVNQ